MTTQPAVRPLFRQQAIEFQQYQRQWGEVVLLQPVSTKLLTWSLAVAVSTIIVFLTFAQYARKDTAIGYLTPSAGTAQVFAPQPGVIREVFVRQGQEVTEGQKLLRVATAQLADDGEDVNTAELAILTQQKTSLVRQIAAEEQRSSAEQQRLTALLANHVREAGSINEQIALHKQRYEIAESLIAMGLRLSAKGLMSVAEVKQREEAALDMKARLAALGGQEAGLTERIIETRSTIDQLATVMAGKLQPLRTELSSTEQRIAEINGRRAYVVRAPITGRVSLMQANIGQPADPRRLQLEIVPANAVLRAVLFVPARAAGFVDVGQPVRLLYDAFPYQKYGTHGGRIIEVSRTTLTGGDVFGPTAPKEPAYKVVAALDEEAIKTRDRKTIPLQPDMLLHADIILERRTILSWVLEPLLSARM